ncbi:hypothetical protein EVAR_66694_1 [Eumeta japonica]|uniref:Uncharacterized protein n=1 Tax=Eumeta variegata TaxID=151549 RepID=A0A4C1ZPW8_EUMVA|nr:hypothetical protein EVAR_66694_1 [Eumeta japonica]
MSGYSNLQVRCKNRLKAVEIKCTVEYQNIVYKLFFLCVTRSNVKYATPIVFVFCGYHHTSERSISSVPLVSGASNRSSSSDGSCQDPSSHRLEREGNRPDKGGEMSRTQFEQTYYKDPTVGKTPNVGKTPTMPDKLLAVSSQAVLCAGGVVTHAAPSYDEQRASPALLGRGAGTPGGRSARDDGYCSAGSTPKKPQVLLSSLFRRVFHGARLSRFYHVPESHLEFSIAF